MYDALAEAAKAFDSPTRSQRALGRHNTLVRDWITRLAAEDAGDDNEGSGGNSMKADPPRRRRWRRG
jgi:hypothetical protein